MTERPVWIQTPTPATEHPIRCAATWPAFPGAYDFDRHPKHQCIHPALKPTAVIGLLEHLCDCGTGWVQPTTTPILTEAKP